MEAGAVPFEWHEYRQGWQTIQAEVIEEALVTVYVNGLELNAVLCTPRDLGDLALGFLANEGLIEGMGEVDHVHLSAAGCCVDVWLNHALAQLHRRITTTGCGGGVTFDDPSVGLQPLPYDLRLRPETLFDLFRHLNPPGSLYSRSRGVHAAAISDGQAILAMAEDVGRHNTLDKLRGMCLRQGIETRGRILLATGRVSAEMLHKGARMGCPIVASRNSATSMSIATARAWNVTLVGYVRQGSMQVYTHPERLNHP